MSAGCVIQPNAASVLGLLRTARRQGAAVLASLRNLAIGVYELKREQARATVDTLRAGCLLQAFSIVWPIVQR